MTTKFPPTYTVEPLTTKHVTPRLSLPGFHGVARPVAMSNAARPFRDWPPTVPNPPYTYSVEPLAVRPKTELSGFGFQEVAWPVAASTAARKFRVEPPMLVKAPPA